MAGSGPEVTPPHQSIGARQRVPRSDSARSHPLKYRDLAQRGARFLLCDGVGLGKTLQLGAIAKLIGTLDDQPILIMAPKPLLAQWQEELLQKLAIPSVRWEAGGWMTERDEFHPALPGRLTNCPRKIGIVSSSVVTSAPSSEPPKARTHAHSTTQEAGIVGNALSDAWTHKRTPIGEKTPGAQS